MKNHNESDKKKYDGVVYEPSQATRNRQGAGRQAPSRQASDKRASSHGGMQNGVVRRSADGPRPRTRASGRRRPAKKSNFALFYVFTLFTGIMVCIVVFTIFFNSFSNNTSGKQIAASTPSPAPTDIVVNEMKQILGVIQSLDVRTGLVRILDSSAGSYHDLYYDSTTELTNKFGQVIVFSEFKAGDMVDANFNPKTGRLKSLSVSSQAWEYKQIKNVIVNAVQQTVTIGNDIFNFDDGLVVTYNNEEYLVHSVREMDLCTVRGFRNKVYSIIVHKSHGSIEIINKDYIKDGFIEINTDIYMELSAAEYIELQEGSYRIVVKGGNIEPYVKEIELGAKENIRVDLEQAIYKTGVVFISANVSGYVVVVDDRQVVSDEGITLDYGMHTLRVERADYEVWQKDINVNAPRIDVPVVMTAIVKMGKLVVDTVPSGAQLFIDNQLMGITPFEGSFEQGGHTLMLRMSGYQERTHQITVTDSDPPYIFEMLPAVVNIPSTVTAAPTAAPAE